MNNNNESNIKFRDLFSLFVSNLWIMVLVAVVVASGVFAYGYFTYEPTYESTGSMYILRQGEIEDSIDYSSNFNVALSVVNDCKTLLTSHTVLDRVIEENDLQYTYGELNSLIEINNPSNTRYLEITVKAHTPEEAKLIVDSISRIGEAEIDEVMGFNQINPFDSGTLASVPSNSPFEITFALLGAVVAFLLTFVVIVLAFIFDDKVSDPEMVEKSLELSVLAVIPNFEKYKPDKDTNYYVGKTATKRHRYYQTGRKERK